MNISNNAKSEDEFPEFLYRYRSNNTPYVCEELKKSVRRREIYFSSLTMQNDPFDCNPSYYRNPPNEIAEYYRKFRPGKLLIEEETVAERFPPGASPGLKRRVRRDFRPTPENIERVMTTGDLLIQQQRRRAYICCFSEIWDSALMWSHYSNSHQGYCIKYRLRHDLMQKFDNRFPLDVQYSKDRPKLSMLDLLEFADSSESDLHGENATRVFHALAYQKSDVWKYEKEWRIHSIGDGAPGYRPAIAMEPVEIILGATSDKRLASIIRNRVDRNIAISKVILDPDRYSLSLGSP